MAKGYLNHVMHNVSFLSRLIPFLRPQEYLMHHVIYLIRKIGRGTKVNVEGRK